MYISRLLIDVGSNPDRLRPGRLWLRNPYRVHQRLCMAFPAGSKRASDPHFLAPFDPKDFGMSEPRQVNIARGVQTGFLFRVDPLTGGRAMILVQSAIKPDWAYAFCNAGFFLAAPPEIRSFQQAFIPGQLLCFRLKANPTKKIVDDKHPRTDGSPKPARVGLFGQEKQMNWFHNKADKGGFKIIECRITAAENSDSKKEGINGTIRHLGVTFEGLLEVTDADLFHKTMENGIGSAKGFGFGLLSVAPVRK